MASQKFNYNGRWVSGEELRRLKGLDVVEAVEIQEEVAVEEVSLPEELEKGVAVEEVEVKSVKKSAGRPKKSK